VRPSACPTGGVPKCGCDGQRHEKACRRVPAGEASAREVRGRSGPLARATGTAT
jgi:hypothetical protein